MAQTETVVLKLPPILDLRAAAPLAKELEALRFCPLAIDASAVERLGGLGLQVLISARTSWAIDGTPLSIVNPSTEFLQCAAELGALEREEEAA